MAIGEEIEYDDEGYNTDLLREVQELGMLGLTDEQISKVWGITMHQFQDLKKDKRFRDALEAGKVRADGKVAYALYQRATGYEYYEQRIGFYQGEAIVANVKRHMPADPWSAVKWLSVRNRAVWSEKHQIEITNTNININKIDFSGLSDEELLLLQRIQVKQLTKNAGGN